MSSPDTRSGQESMEEEDTSVVNAFWAEMMKRFGKEETYLKQLISAFGRSDGVEILIVVNKLLTGFDEPRNTVLYIDRSFKEHGVLQAIARVNRIYPRKEHGFIVDYRGILGKLNKAMNTYDALSGFDAADVDLTGAVVDTHTEVRTLPQKHSDLWDVFKEVQNRHDNEALERHLVAAEDRRHDFYEALTAYRKTLEVALATEHFYEETPAERIKTYKDDLAFFRSLRASVQQRCSETVDYSQYEKQIRRVMDSNIQAPDIQIVTNLVNIFDVEAFDQEVEHRVGDAAKADTIASRLVKTLHEKMDENPVFYRKFADLVQQAIDDYRQQRISDTEYLRRVTEFMATVRQGHESDLPAQLTHYPEASAYYLVVREVVDGYGTKAGNGQTMAADIALHIDKIISKLKQRDWITTDDILKDMQNAIDDYLFEVRDQHDISLSTTDMDAIIEGCISIARKLAGG